MKSSHVPRSAVIVPLAIVQWTFAQLAYGLFGSGFSMFALPIEPAQIASGLRCSTGGGMVRIVTTTEPRAVQPLASVTVTERVTGWPVASAVNETLLEFAAPSIVACSADHSMPFQEPPDGGSTVADPWPLGQMLPWLRWMTGAGGAGTTVT